MSTSTSLSQLGSFSLATLLWLLPATASAQYVTLPPNGDNQRSEVTQYLGAIAHIHVQYNSPDVTGPQGEDRKGHIWGELVPWDLTDLGMGRGATSPWRAGANENTTIRLSHDMLVEGKLLAAGTYGFHVIPEENGSWTAIFSKDADAWGSYAYDASHDALRVQVTPRTHQHTEWLTYEFIDREPNEAVLALRWESLELPIRFTVPDPEALYIDQIRRELSGMMGFVWEAYNEAAQYCIQNNTNLDEALVWADAAMNMPFVGQTNFTTLQTKAQVLKAMGKKDEAKTLLDQAVKHPTAQAFQIHQYGRQLLAEGDKTEAMRIFELNLARFDGTWPSHVGMMRGLSANGDYKGALKHAKIALTQAPDQLNKASLEQAIIKLQNKEDIN